MRRRKSRVLYFILCAFMIFVLLVIGGWQARRFFPYPAVFARLRIENWQVWEFHDYFGLDPDDVSVVWENRRLTGLDEPPVIYGGNVYFPASFINERTGIDPFLFWDESAQSLLFSTDMEVIRLPADEVLIQGRPMVSLDFVQDKYPAFRIEHRQEFNTVIITDYVNSAGRYAETRRRTAVRYRPDRTAFITKRLDRGVSFIAFAPDGDFFRVRTAEGLLGYINMADMQFADPPRIVARPVSPLPVSPPAFEGPINLSWEMITAPQGNITAMNNPLPPGLNVISPTWFSFDSYALNGNIDSFACREYVEWAHSHGVYVWPKIFDTNRDISHAILTNYRARERAITQLLRFVDEYRLDGIIVNFEHIRGTDGRYYVQFLRELAPEMRFRNAVLTVATFVPAPWFAHYHHDLVGRTVDFVAIMTYDEHYGGSPEPGPVASLPFVRRSVADALQLIPREKLLMGLPFYNRLWHVNPDGSHRISNIGMARPWALVEEWGVIPVWDDEIGSYYVNFNDGTTTYRMWIECERSIGEKLSVYNYFGIAGVASWRRGLESPGVWDKIYMALN